MYDEYAQFDRGWVPKRYPPYSPEDAGVWRYVLDNDDLSPVGVIWLSGESTGVRWLTQTDTVSRLIKFFDQYAAIDTEASDAYLVATQATNGVKLSDERSSPMSDVDAALQQIMDDITEAAD